MSKNRIKSAALGLAHGTAANRLRKMVLFSLVCRLNLNMCYRCDGEILSVGDLSIEHKEAWLQADDPVQSFFDLDNIAFSHLSCNSSAGIRPHKKYKDVKEKWRVESSAKWARLSPEEKRADRKKRYEKYGN